VTRVVAGGRRFSFSVAVVIGNKKGKVGVGIAKGTDTAASIDKAVRDAKNNLITVPMTEDGTLPHEVRTKFASTELVIFPSKGGGLRAGSAVRTVLEMAGVKNAASKILTRSKNKYNNARATIEALKLLRP
jgi:small subunit ribosomal protein S5